MGVGCTCICMADEVTNLEVKIAVLLRLVVGSGVKRALPVLRSLSGLRREPVGQ